MDLQNILAIVLAVMPIIMGLVEFTKKFGVTGKALMTISFVIGGVLAGIGWVYVNYPDAQSYVILFMVIVVGGLAANGLYDLVDSRFPKQ